jgi:lysophospholipase L1-like esterase
METQAFGFRLPANAPEGQKRFPIYIEEEIPVIRKLLGAAAAALLLVSSFAHAEVPWTFSNNTRYLAMGDSLAAGYGAIPVTNGYAYLLYQGGTFDAMTNTIFANAAVPGVKSEHVLAHQVPQAGIFQPHVVTISVGGNDLVTILTNPLLMNSVLMDFQTNLRSILAGLPTSARIIIGNQYDIPIPGIPADERTKIIKQFNEIISMEAEMAGARVRVADVFTAFQGRNGLLLVERHGADRFEVHPTNAGYRVMANAFAAAAR